MKPAIKVLDLCSGIGGFTLGAQMTGGFETIAFCEINQFCQKVLKKNFPNIPIFDDVKSLSAESLQRAGITEIDAICAGFPCQPVSHAGKRRGSQDERYLWPEIYRIVCDVQPRWIVLENVIGLLSAESGRLFRGILWELAEARFDVEWSIVSAASVGAVHRRDRVFIIAWSQDSSANSNCCRCDDGSDYWPERHLQTDQKRHLETASPNWPQLQLKSGQVCADVADAQSSGWYSSGSAIAQAGTDIAPISSGDAIRDSNSFGLENSQNSDQRGAITELRSPESSNIDSERLEAWECSANGKTAIRIIAGQNCRDDRETKVESRLCRAHDGLSSGMDRIRQFGIDNSEFGIRREESVNQSAPRDNPSFNSELRTPNSEFLMRYSDIDYWLPRATDSGSIPHRRERLEALGNAIVPACAAVAWRRVQERICVVHDTNAKG